MVTFVTNKQYLKVYWFNTTKTEKGKGRGGPAGGRMQSQSWAATVEDEDDASGASLGDSNEAAAWQLGTDNAPRTPKIAQELWGTRSTPSSPPWTLTGKPPSSSMSSHRPSRSCY